MDFGQILSWVVGAVGLIGFYISGKRVWWSWYINLGGQALWMWYAVITNQPAFIITTMFYTVVFGLNARKWTKEHLSKKKEVVGNNGDFQKEAGSSRR